MLNRSVASNSELHRVDDLLQLAAALGIHERPDVVLPKKQVPRLAPAAHTRCCTQIRCTISGAGPMPAGARWRKG